MHAHTGHHYLQTMQILATDLGIDQDVKSALAGENGAAEVQSIAFSVVGAVNTLLTQKEPDHNSEQHSPHLGVRHLYHCCASRKHDSVGGHLCSAGRH